MMQPGQEEEEGPRWKGEKRPRWRGEEEEGRTLWKGEEDLISLFQTKMMQPAQEEEEEEGHTLWIGESQNWMDKVEGKEIRTLWIGDLQPWMDEDYIDACFSDTTREVGNPFHTGEVFTSKVFRNAGKSSSDECYGFIEFKSHAIAERILHNFNGTPMPRVTVGTSNFNLNWASSSSSFESGGEQQQQHQEEEEEEDDSAAAADDDKLPKKITMPRQGQPTDLSVNSGWEDMMKWWSIIATETRTPEVVYATHRVYMIGAFLKRFSKYPPDGIIEEWLDELARHVAFIDITKVLHSIDALYRLVDMLYHHQHAGIRGKVTKVIIAMVQKNPTSQQLVMEAGGREALIDAFWTDIDPTLETNYLDAISLLFLNGEPDMSAFGVGDNLIYSLMKPISDLRKALNLVEENKCKFKYPRMMTWLVSSVESVDAEIRKAALRGLIKVAQVRKVVNSGQGSEIDNMFKEFLQGWIERIIAMAPENLAPFRDEIPLVEKLWKACYNDEHFPLREEEGLFVLLGEDTLAS